MDWQTLIETDRQVLAWFNGSDSLLMDGFITTLTAGYTWIPLYLALFYLVLKNNETMAQIMLATCFAALCVVVANGVDSGLVKPWVARLRPGNDLDIKYAVDVVENMRGTDYSFFSAHACNTFSLAVFFSLLVRHKVFTIFMMAWSLLNCYTRLYLAMHFPSDILVGLLWGGLVGLAVYLVYIRIYLRISPKLNYISSQYTSTGYSLTDLNVVYTVIVFTLTYAVFRSLYFAWQVLYA